MNRTRFTLLIAVLTALLSSCAPAPAASTPAEVATLQRYFQALADKDEQAYTRLLCPTWETEALLEFDAYKGVKSSLQDLSCQRVDGQTGSANVRCQGTLSLSYGNERQTVDLSQRTYRLTSSGGDWQVCGFTTPAQ